MPLSEKVTAALTELYDRDGVLKPTVIVQTAKKKTSPLHGCFTWDDSKAAEQHRLWEARHLIKRVRIVHESREDRFVHVSKVAMEGPGDSMEGGYYPISVVVKQIDDFERAVNELLTKMAAIKQTVNELKAAAGKRSNANHVAIVLQSLAAAEEGIRLLRAS